MAQTKTRSKPKAKSKSQGSSKPKKSRSKSTSKRTSPNGSKASSAGKPKAASKPNGLMDKTKAAGATVEETAKDAGRKVGRVASKAKVPLMAGGAALAGAGAGMAALSARQGHHRHRGLGKALGGVNSKDLKKAAKKAGDVGAQVGEIALEVRRARERTNSNGAHRSPIEVVLQGLTARRPKE
jgi:hypothetical protein